MASIKIKSNDSPCWKAIMKVKHIYMAGRRVVIQSGDVARLWIDPIGNNTPLAEQFPRLFSICNFPECTVAQCLNADPSSFFRRRLNSELNDQWVNVSKMAREACVSEASDVIRWGMGGKSSFTTKSVYSFLERNIAGCDYRWI